MNALEFSAKIEKGVIRLPDKYKEYDNSYVRVIVLTKQSEQHLSQKERLKATFKKLQLANLFGNIENPTAWKNELRDEW